MMRFNVGRVRVLNNHPAWSTTGGAPSNMANTWSRQEAAARGSGGRSGGARRVSARPPGAARRTRWRVASSV